ncbi:unnamed protein product [Parnassius mnemosyne]|uniref:Peptidase aspartic putative domain-containing protein n=1 Tax=Parnassius mnemosyne TaxID=213953 RepID=A0AAV1M927_9NEOP
MDSAEKRMKVQCDSYENIQRAYANFKKAPKERITVGYVTSRLDSLEVYWKDFKCLHQKIIQETSKEERKSCYYFDYEVYDHFEELYYTYKGELRNALQKLQPDTDTENKAQQLEQRLCQKPSDTKLPRITIPIFSGDYTEWQSFHDLFLALIHKNDTLEDVQKLHYLKSNLKGDAEVLLRQFAITGENYAEAWSALKRRYDNKRYIANCIFKKFFSQKPLPFESANLLKQLLDTSVECINSLKNLGLPTSHWDAIVNFVIVSKLDTVTHKQWEESIGKNSTEDLPSFDHLKGFLETKFRTLEMVEPAKKITKPINPKSFHAADAENVPCSYCKEKHYIFNCKKFVKQPTEERYKFVQSNNLCFNCLMPNHTVFKCKNTISCKICKKRHHSLLHNDRKHLTTNEKMTTEGTTSKQQDETEIKVTAHMSKEQPGQRILLATALVDITSRAGQTHVFRALIDQGSEASFVTARVVDLLGLRRTNINGVVSGVGGEGRICINHMAELVVKSKCVSNFSVNIKAYVLKSLTRRLPAKEVKICGWPQLKSMKLADPHFHTPSRIDILLGADVFCKIIGSGLIRGPGNLVAQYTNLGWILSGSVSKSASSLPQITSLHVTRLDDETNNLLRKFWEIDVEHYRSKKILTKEETKCEEIYKNTTTRDETGRYVVQLPLKQSYEDTVRMCGDTKKLAITRLESLEKRFFYYRCSFRIFFRFFLS